MRFADPDQPAIPSVWGDLMQIAVRQQLGLNLVKRKEPLEITVVDHAEEPGDN